jgi:flagellar motor switch protein FliM
LTSTPAPASDAVRERRRARTSEPTAYDFRKPIQLSREHARVLQLGLSGFARQATTVFTSSLRTVSSVQLLSVSQEVYSEYVDSLNAPTYLIKFAAEPMPGLGVMEIPLPAIMSCVDLMLGGPGSQRQPVRALTEIESGVVGGLVERLLGEMAYSMAAIVESSPSLVGIEYSPQFAQAAGAGDVMVVATFDLRIGERSERMTICLPFSGLKPFLARAAAPAPVSERERAQRAHAAELMQQRLSDVPVPVSVRFRPSRQDPDTLTSLAVGDVLVLDHPAAAPLDVIVDDATFAHATPGTRGARLAALIVGTPKEKA